MIRITENIIERSLTVILELRGWNYVNVKINVVQQVFILTQLRDPLLLILMSVEVRTNYKN